MKTLACRFSFLKKIRVGAGALVAVAAVAVATAEFSAVPAQAASAAKQSSQATPSTCVPVSRETAAWWKERNEHFNALAQERSAKIVFLGDSITHFWNGEGAKAPGQKPWMDGSAAWEKYFAPLDAVAFGCSGDKTENVLWRLDNGNLSGKMDPRLVVLMIGTNNWQNRPEETAQGVKAILERIKKSHPKTKVLLLAIFPRGANKDDPKRKTNDAVNALIKKYADNSRVFFLDIGKEFLSKDAAQTLPKSIMPDLLHPNAEGYEIWAKAILPKVKQLSK